MTSLHEEDPSPPRDASSLSSDSSPDLYRPTLHVLISDSDFHFERGSSQINFNISPDTSFIILGQFIFLHDYEICGAPDELLKSYLTLYTFGVHLLIMFRFSFNLLFFFNFYSYW